MHPLHPPIIVIKSINLIHQWNTVDILNPLSALRFPLPNIRQPPPGQTVKPDFDQSFSQKDLSAGIGGIFRNTDGLMLLAFAKQIVATSPIETELEALHEGLNLCLKERFNDIIVERGDSLTTINSLENNLNLSWKLMKISKRIQSLLKLCTSWKVSFCGQVIKWLIN